MTDVEAYFMDMFRTRKKSGLSHGEADWDQRAEEWRNELETDEGFRKRTGNRVNSVTSYLLSRGVLFPEAKVIDIGCGPGQQVISFAGHATHVTGTDFSKKMLDFSARCAAEAGLQNVSFVQCDFQTCAPAAFGWEKQFDLVFSSITPATKNPEEWDKMISMSRAYCFSALYVNAENSFASSLVKTVFGIDADSLRDSRDFYVMWNLLWLKGYLPETYYHEEIWEDRMRSREKDAVMIAAKYIGTHTDREVSRIMDYLNAMTDEEGYYTARFCTEYGFLLWDVRKKKTHLYG